MIRDVVLCLKCAQMTRTYAVRNGDHISYRCAVCNVQVDFDITDDEPSGLQIEIDEA